MQVPIQQIVPDGRPARASYAFSDQLSAKLEYLHFDLGSVIYLANKLTAAPPAHSDWHGMLIRRSKATSSGSGLTTDLFRKSICIFNVEAYSASARVRSINTFAAVLNASN